MKIDTVLYNFWKCLVVEINANFIISFSIKIGVEHGIFWFIIQRNCKGCGIHSKSNLCNCKILSNRSIKGLSRNFKKTR